MPDINFVGFFKARVDRELGKYFDQEVATRLQQIIGTPREPGVYFAPQAGVYPAMNPYTETATGGFRVSAHLQRPDAATEALLGSIQTPGVRFLFEKDPQYMHKLEIIGDDAQAVVNNFNKFAEAVLKARGSRIPPDTVQLSLPNQLAVAEG